MKVVLDTNIVMASISRFSPYSLVLDAFRARQYQLCLTTDITLEYEEKLFEHFLYPSNLKRKQLAIPS